MYLAKVIGNVVSTSKDPRLVGFKLMLTRRLDESGGVDRPDLRESGFWRIADDDTIELLLAHAEGWIELFYGRPLNQTSWNLTTDVVIRSETGAHAGGVHPGPGGGEVGSDVDHGQRAASDTTARLASTARPSAMPA